MKHHWTMTLHMAAMSDITSQAVYYSYSAYTLCTIAIITTVTVSVFVAGDHILYEQDEAEWQNYLSAQYIQLRNSTVSKTHRHTS